MDGVDVVVVGFKDGVVGVVGDGDDVAVGTPVGTPSINLIHWATDNEEESEFPVKKMKEINKISKTKKRRMKDPPGYNNTDMFKNKYENFKRNI